MLQGLRLFEGSDARRIAPEIIEACDSPLVTHLRYTVPSQVRRPANNTRRACCGPRLHTRAGNSHKIVRRR